MPRDASCLREIFSRSRAGFGLGSWALYIIVFVCFFPELRISRAPLALVPIILAAIFWGGRAGFVAAMTGLSIHGALLYLLNVPSGEMGLAAVFGPLSLVLVGLGVGKLNNYRHEVKTLLNEQGESQKQLEENRELDRLRSDFISSVTHELRTPLVSLKGFTEILLKYSGEIGKEDSQKSLRAIKRNAQRLERLISDILTLSGIERGVFSIQKERVAIKELVAGCLLLIKDQTKNHLMELSWGTGIPERVDCDAQRLEQVLLNLLGNAIKYSPGGGKICIFTEGAPNTLRISVRDQGLGIPAPEQVQIFEKFGRVRAESHKGIEGTGIGLYLSKYIMDAHGGKISVRSQPGEGSTFCISLPLETTQKVESSA